MILIGSLLLTLTLAASAGAQQRRQTQFRNNFAGRLQIGQFVKNLQLSDTQRADIKAMLRARQPEILVARTMLLKARIALLNNEPNAPQNLAAAHAEIAGLRQVIAKQIESNLTAEQLTKLQNRRQRQADLLNRRLQRLEEQQGTN